MDAVLVGIEVGLDWTGATGEKRRKHREGHDQLTHYMLGGGAVPLVQADRMGTSKNPTTRRWSGDASSWAGSRAGYRGVAEGCLARKDIRSDTRSAHRRESESKYKGISNHDIVTR